MQHGTAAHGAGLQGDEQFAAVQPVVAQHLGRRTQGLDFGMRRGVVAVDRCVAAGGDGHAVLQHHRPHRHLARSRSQAGLGQGELHGVFVGHRVFTIVLIAACADGISTSCQKGLRFFFGHVAGRLQRGIQRLLDLLLHLLD